MPTTLGVPESMLKPVGAFVEEEGIPVSVVAGGDCTVQVVESAEHQASTSSVLQAGGWIACSTAHSVAAKLGTTLRDMGKLLDHLDIRIRECQLGCFE